MPFETLASRPDALAIIALVPAVGALLIDLTGKSPALRDTITLVTAAATAALVGLGLLPHVLSAGPSEPWTLAVLPNLELSLAVDRLGMTYATVAAVLWLVTSLYAIGYVRANKEKNQTRFFVCFAIAISAALGIAFSGNLPTLFVFYEVLTLSTFPLVTHKATPDAVRAGRTYLGILVATSVCLLLLGVIGVHTIADGDTAFRVGGLPAIGRLAATSPVTVAAIYLLFLFGAAKAALMPFHRWLPAAMVAPTPVSALLHAVAVVKAGVFTIAKVTDQTFGVETLAQIPPARDLFPWIAATTIVIASAIAMRQDNLKRRLAYSTISQLAYISLGATLFCSEGIRAAQVHIGAHACAKITLFFGAGAIYTAAHLTKVSELDGIGRRMPWTMGAFTIGALSMIGVPPTAGFLSKWMLVEAAWTTENAVALIALLGSTALNAGYFLPIVHRAFFRKPPEGAPAHGEAPWPLVVALSLTAATTILLFLRPDWVLALAGAAGRGGLG